MVDTDASGEGLGAVLSQVVGGCEHILAYASRVLSNNERKYCATRREMLALVWAVHHFRPYLYGKEFQIRTDHNCLKWLLSFKEPEGQVARWLEALAIKSSIVQVNCTVMQTLCHAACVGSVGHS